MELVAELIPGAAPAGAQRVAALDHESGDHAMEDGPVVEPVLAGRPGGRVGPLATALGEIGKIPYRLRGVIGKEPDDHRTHIGLQRRSQSLSHAWHPCTVRRARRIRVRMVEPADGGKCECRDHIREVVVSLTTSKDEAQARSVPATAPALGGSAGSLAQPGYRAGQERERDRVTARAVRPRVGHSADRGRHLPGPRLGGSAHRPGRAGGRGDCRAEGLRDARDHRAARRPDPGRDRAPIWPRVIATVAVLAAAGGAVVVILRGRSAGPADTLMAEEEMIPAPSEPDTASTEERVMADGDIAGNAKKASSYLTSGQAEIERGLARAGRPGQTAAGSASVRPADRYGSGAACRHAARRRPRCRRVCPAAGDPAAGRSTMPLCY